MTDNNIGDFMSEGREQAFKTLAIVAGLLVYVAVIGYSGVHNWRLLTSGIDPNLIIPAAVGVLALEISALALPLALHFWTHDHMQRIAAFAFYALDLGLIIFNVILAFSINVGELAYMPPWLIFYLHFVTPITPLIVGLGWSILFLLDPTQRERAMIQNLQASTQAILAKRIAEKARLDVHSKSVDQAAATMAQDIIERTLGHSLNRTAPRNVIDASFKAEKSPSGNGKAVFNQEVEGVTNRPKADE